MCTGRSVISALRLTGSTHYRRKFDVFHRKSSQKMYIAWLAVLMLACQAERVASMSLDRLGIDQNELHLSPVEKSTADSELVVDDMELEPVSAVGNAEMYVLVPAGTTSERESVDRNTIESGASEIEEPQQESGDMLMVETNEVPVPVVLPAELALAPTDNKQTAAAAVSIAAETAEKSAESEVQDEGRMDDKFAILTDKVLEVPTESDSMEVQQIETEKDNASGTNAEPVHYVDRLDSAAFTEDSAAESNEGSSEQETMSHIVAEAIVELENDMNSSSDSQQNSEATVAENGDKNNEISQQASQSEYDEKQDALESLAAIEEDIFPEQMSLVQASTGTQEATEVDKNEDISENQTIEESNEVNAIEAQKIGENEASPSTEDEIVKTAEMQKEDETKTSASVEILDTEVEQNPSNEKETEEKLTQEQMPIKAPETAIVMENHDQPALDDVGKVEEVQVNKNTEIHSAQEAVIQEQPMQLNEAESLAAPNSQEQLGSEAAEIQQIQAMPSGMDVPQEPEATSEEREKETTETSDEAAKETMSEQDPETVENFDKTEEIIVDENEHKPAVADEIAEVPETENNEETITGDLHKETAQSTQAEQMETNAQVAVDQTEEDKENEKLTNLPTSEETKDNIASTENNVVAVETVPEILHYPLPTAEDISQQQPDHIVAINTEDVAPIKVSSTEVTQDVKEPNSSLLTTILQIPQQQGPQSVEEQMISSEEMTEVSNQPLEQPEAAAETVAVEQQLPATEEKDEAPIHVQATISAIATEEPATAPVAPITASTTAPLIMDSVLNYVNGSIFMQQTNNNYQQQEQQQQQQEQQQQQHYEQQQQHYQQQQQQHQHQQQQSPEDEEYNAQLRRYDGAQVWRIVVQNDHDKRLADELQTKYGGQLWKEVKQEVDYLLKPQVLSEAAQHIRAANLSRIVLIDNLQKAIETENPTADEIAQFQNRKGHRLTWQAYHRLEDIHGFLDYLAKAYPDICAVETIGYSLEKRPLKILKISNGNASNPGIWIDGGMHAREWISPATVTYIANQLVEGWDDLPAHMRNINWYIHSIANPDGYEYTHTTDRLWRKNMRSHGRQCPGVDLNRNFGYKWGGKGTSANPCSQTYRGSKAFSEPETFYISKFISNYPRDTFHAYLSFHSYGQYILYPWGYDYYQTMDQSDLDRVARQAGTTITKKSGGKYTVGSSATTLYPAAGGSDDWAKGFAGIKYSYTIEMGDTGRYGFVLPASHIEINGKDGFTFVETVARAIRQDRVSRKRIF